MYKREWANGPKDKVRGKGSNKWKAVSGVRQETSRTYKEGEKKSKTLQSWRPILILWAFKTLHWGKAPGIKGCGSDQGHMVSLNDNA